MKNKKSKKLRIRIDLQRSIVFLIESVDELTARVEQLALELFELKNEVSDQEFEQKLKEKEDEKQD